jgi:hypothetical protein
MKRLLILVALLLSLTPSRGQQRFEYDEECGCDLLFVDGIQTTREGDLYGFRLEDGTQIVPNIYMHVGQFTDGYCKVMPADTLCGLIDREGRLVVPCIYNDVDYPSDGRVLVIRNGRAGFTDLKGNEVLPLRYLNAGSFSEGYAPVMVALDSFFSACTFIDTMGRQLVPPHYDNLQPFSCGIALVMQYQRWGVIDHSGRELIPPMFEQITTVFDTLFFAGDLDGMALYDRRMKPLTKQVYTWTGGINDGRIAVQRDGKYGFLDRQGREVIPCIYDEISLFGSCRAMVRLGDRYGIIDTAGLIVLPIEYESRTTKGEKYVYHDGLALVEQNGKLGYVDLDGQLVIPFYLDEAFQFSEGLGCALFKGRWGYVDTKGDIYLPFIFDVATPFHWGRADIAYDGEFRVMDRKGRCVKNCKGIIAWRDWRE